MRLATRTLALTTGTVALLGIGGLSAAFADGIIPAPQPSPVSTPAEMTVSPEVSAFERGTASPTVSPVP